MPEQPPSPQPNPSDSPELPPELTDVAQRLTSQLTLPEPSPRLEARILASVAAVADAGSPAGPVSRPTLRFPAVETLARAAAVLLVGLLSGWGVRLATPRTQFPLGPEQASNQPLDRDQVRIVGAEGVLGAGAQPLERGAVVGPGEPLVVRPDGHLVLELAEGTQLAFDGGSQATLDFGPRARRVRLSQGRLYADVTPVGSTWEGRPLVLHTPSGRARVLGTELTLTAGQALSELAVRHGQVRLENAFGQALVGAQETGVVAYDRRPQSRTTASVDRHFRWIGKLAPGPRHPAEKPFGGGPLSEDEPAIGSLVARRPDGSTQPLRLLEQRVTTELRDGLARTTVRFRFLNPSPQTLEGTFRFALPKRASISRYAVTIDGEWVSGHVVEKEAARRIYAEEKRRLNQPALLEWQSGSAFEAKVFPLEAQAVKELEVGYTEELRERHGVTRLLLPLVSEASRLSPPEVLTIEARLLGSENEALVRCPSHFAEIGQGARGQEVRLRAEHLTPRNDFVLELARPALPQVEARRQAVTGELGPEPHALSLRIRPDLGWLGDDLAPEQVVVLVDASRSMSGTLKEVQLETLEALLGALPSRVHPRVFLHHVELEELDPRGPDRDEALLAGLWHADTLGASDLALAFRQLGRRLPFNGRASLVYLGDGLATTGERDPARLQALFQAALPPDAVSRLITVGIGSDTDAVLMERLARARQGVHVEIRPGDDLGEKLDAVVGALTEPVLAELQVAVDLPGFVLPAPAAVGNLRRGEVIQLSARQAGPITRESSRGVVRLSGLLGGRPYRLEAPFVVQDVPDDAGLEELWARRRVEDLQQAGDRDGVLDLALHYGLVTPYTSLLVLSPVEAERYRLESQTRRAVRLGQGRGELFRLLQVPAPVVWGRLEDFPGDRIRVSGGKGFTYDEGVEAELGHAASEAPQTASTEPFFGRTTTAAAPPPPPRGKAPVRGGYSGQSDPVEEPVDLPVEAPLVILEEEAEVAQDVPEGTDLSNFSNKNLDPAGLGGGFGGGGAPAGAAREDRAVDERGGQKRAPAERAPASREGRLGDEERKSNLALWDERTSGSADQSRSSTRAKEAGVGGQRSEVLRSERGESSGRSRDGRYKADAQDQGRSRRGLSRPRLSAGTEVRAVDEVDQLRKERSQETDRLDGEIASLGRSRNQVQERLVGEARQRAELAALGKSLTRAREAGPEVTDSLRRIVADGKPREEAEKALKELKKVERIEEVRERLTPDTPDLARLRYRLTQEQLGRAGKQNADLLFSYGDLAGSSSDGDEQVVAGLRAGMEQLNLDDVSAMLEQLDEAQPSERGEIFDFLRAVTLDGLGGRPAYQASVSESLLRYQPTDLDLHEALARALARLGLPERARRAASGLVEAQPDSGEARRRYALFLERLGLQARALAEMQAAVAQDPALPRAHFGVARLAIRDGRWDLAEAALLGVLARNFDPYAEGGRTAHAQALVGLRSLYQRAQRLFPNLAATYRAALERLESGAFWERTVEIRFFPDDGRSGSLSVRAPGEVEVSGERPFSPKGGLLHSGQHYSHTERLAGPWQVSVDRPGTVVAWVDGRVVWQGALSAGSFAGFQVR